MIEDPIALYVLQYAKQFGLKQELERILNLKENKELELLLFIKTLFVRLDCLNSQFSSLKELNSAKKVLHWPHNTVN